MSEANFAGRMSMYFVYVLRNKDDGSWYIGYTEDINRRIREHNEGRGGTTTRKKKSWELMYFEGYRNKKDALGREKFLKGGSGRTYLKKQMRFFLESLLI
jgi:putative endonuclease